MDGSPPQMKPYFKMSQTISRSVDEVFATVVRLDEFPRWSPRNPWAKKLTPGDIGEGTRFQMGRKGFGSQGVKTVKETAAALQRYLEREG